MRSRLFIALCITTLVAVVAPLGALAQTPSSSPDPADASCMAMTDARPPIPDALLVQPFGAQNPAFPNPDAAYAGRFHPGEDWASPSAAGGSPVAAIGPGRVVAVGTIGTGDRGGIVVLEHAGPFSVPASTPGAAWNYTAQTVDAIVSVYQGVDTAPGLMVGDCVDPLTPLGTISAQCGAGVPLPCSDLPARLHLELRLATTLDDAMHSADWSTVGPETASSGGYFLDPQQMVDAGLREPSAFIASQAAACPASSPASSPAPSASVPSTGPCAPTPTLSPEPTPTPTPIRSPATALVRGIPESIRDTCEPRTTGLVTGTIAAVDCHPDSGRIRLLSYFLLRPADARFVFSSRMREYDLGRGADCASGAAGIESASPSLSVGCFVDDEGRANLRFVTRATCPAVYTGVLGSGRDIGALSRAFDTAVGGQWQDPGSSLGACRSDTGTVSPPPAPTNVVFEVHAPTGSSAPAQSYRLEVSWDQEVDADTTIEVWAVTTCPRQASRSEGRCLTRQTRLPGSIRTLVASAPAGVGSVSWRVPAWEVDYGPVALDGRTEYWAIVVRAVNSRGASDWVIAINGNGYFCSDCTA